ncbi:MAG: GntR family transcriptional regulator [Lachnospiraceae bacterium]|nr:GntR family transcriptional regulator [Lachnospiraceae bacterium]MBP3296711.1 GntR family transcriptional regulator [Lachnospiraceae bacterium]
MFQIDPLSHIPVYEQLINQTETFVLTDILSEGDQLPSTRMLAARLSVNPNTIQKAFIEMERRGITRSVPGKGVFISREAKEILRTEHINELKELKEYLAKFRLAGITENEIINCVKEVYGGEDQ